MVSSIYLLTTNLDSSICTTQTIHFSDKQYADFKDWTTKWKVAVQLIIYLLRFLWPVMLSGHHNKVNTPLLNWIPWFILTENRHAEIGFIRDSAFSTWIWGHIHRSRMCIIPEEDTTSSWPMIGHFRNANPLFRLHRQYKILKAAVTFRDYQ